MDNGSGWKLGPIIVSVVGALGLIATAWFGAQEPSAQRVQQSASKTVDLQAQEYRAYVEARVTACKATLEWFKDEKPNPAISAPDQKILLQDMRSHLATCDFPVPSVPGSTDIVSGKGDIKDGGGLVSGGGTTGGGGSGGNYQ